MNVDSGEVNMSDKVAIVTGSNKGIGLAIVKELCKRGVGVVYLTARDVNRGKEAVASLEKENLHPKFHQLDVSDEESVKTLAEYIKKNYKGLDILVNNAGLLDPDFHSTNYKDAKRIIDTNYHGVLLMQKYFFPILNENGRVINVSSGWGHITNLRNSDWIQRLSKEDLNMEDVNSFVNWFLDSVKNGTLKAEDFIDGNVLAYRVSKVALCALTRVQQKIVDKNISINSLHPGFVRTNMTKGAGYITTDESADIIAYLALDIDQSIKGRYFWCDRTEMNWTDTSLDVVDLFEKFEKCIEDVGK